MLSARRDLVPMNLGSWRWRELVCTVLRKAIESCARLSGEAFVDGLTSADAKDKHDIVRPEMS